MKCPPDYLLAIKNHIMYIIFQVDFKDRKLTKEIRRFRTLNGAFLNIDMKDSKLKVNLHSCKQRYVAPTVAGKGLDYTESYCYFLMGNEKT